MCMVLYEASKHNMKKTQTRNWPSEDLMEKANILKYGDYLQFIVNAIRDLKEIQTDYYRGWGKCWEKQISLKGVSAAGPQGSRRRSKLGQWSQVMKSEDTEISRPVAASKRWKGSKELVWHEFTC